MTNANSGWSWCPGHISSATVHLARGRKKGKQPVLLRNILDDLSNESIFSIPCPSVRLLRVFVVLQSQRLSVRLLSIFVVLQSQCPSVRLLRVSVVNVRYAHGVFPPSRARQAWLRCCRLHRHCSQSAETATALIQTLTLGANFLKNEPSELLSTQTGQCLLLMIKSRPLRESEFLKMCFDDYYSDSFLL